MKISIIVPVYNVEKYLSKCIDSIINQTYKNIEIILVDDGSTDNSSKICDKYAKKDNRIKVIHKKNGGLSDARNVGIENANGIYVSFIDSDDYVELTMIERLYNSCLKYNSEISCCGKFVEYDNKVVLKNIGKDFCVSSKEALVRMLTFDNIDTSAWDKLYLKELFDEIHYPLHVYYEDMGTTYKLIDSANKVSFIKTPEYHYLIRKGSILNSKFNEKYFSSIKFAEEINDFINKHHPDLKKASEAYYLLSISNTMQKIFNSKVKNKYIIQYTELRKKLRNNSGEILKNKYIPNYKKIMIIFTILGLYKTINIIKKFKY